MKLIFKGAYNGKEESLPHGELYPGSILLDDEADNSARILNILNVLGLVIDGIFFIFFSMIAGISNFDFNALIIGFLTLVPHELFHAVCFKNEVYMYYWLEKFCMFVIGLEPMSKSRFIFMSLLPNIVFGFLPFILFLLKHDLTLLGSLCVVTIGMGVGDYYNVINALRRVPKGAKIYSHKFNTYWYFPESIKNEER